jgi:hypothetical protein
MGFFMGLFTQVKSCQVLATGLYARLGPVGQGPAGAFASHCRTRPREEIVREKLCADSEVEVKTWGQQQGVIHYSKRHNLSCP